MFVKNPVYQSKDKAHELNSEISYDSSGAVLSRYRDDVWDFTPDIKNKNVSRSRAIIDFNVKLSNGSKLTDVENSNYLSELKEYLYTRYFVNHPKSGKSLKPQSLIGKFYSYQTLINFLLNLSLPSVAEFRPVHTKQYIDFIKERNPIIKSNTLLQYLTVLEDTYHFRNNLTNGLNQHPWPDSSVVFLSGDRHNNGLYFERQTPCIPDYLCSELLQKSVKFIELNSSRLIKVNQLLEELLDEPFNEAISRGGQCKEITSERKDVIALYAARRGRNYIKTRNNVIKDYGFDSIKQLTAMTHQARTCCYVIIALLTGMRNSEISSLKSGCFSPSLGWDDEEYLWLHGYTFKLEDAPKPVKWMAPAIVSLAINYLESIVPIFNKAIDRCIPYLTEKQKLEQKEIKGHLFICKDLKSSTYNCVSNSHWNRELTELADMFELSVREPVKGLLLLPGDIYPLKSHMFRRTFAVLAARSALGDIRYLREHFKHISIDMSLHYANNDDYDDTLFDEIQSERNSLQRALVHDWIATDQPLAGGRGEAIVAFKQRGVVKSADNNKQLLNQISDSVYVRGTGHSWCLASGDGCGGEGLYDALLCADCKNAVIDRSLLKVWESIELQHQELFTLFDSGVGTIEHAKRLIDVSQRIREKLS
ncbi:tyrosine-type recombinase/integrase [Vibrio sp. MED222]|uniref:tyrosine-type recombinase/integrase n=1 Tax=Vibrio sp. MED222 TaxID=314290 RepID=UPI000068C385|nr:tyrosine-type recombinase/integrase [Vibrio sp. MED222]EAQ52320.1 hypothetical protein MED222_16606 [Vibrio sp. MED222]